MTIKQLRTTFISALEKQYPDSECLSFFYRLTEAYLSMTRLDVSLKLQKNISQEFTQKFEDATKRLQQHEPIQYILGETEFMGLKFSVSPAVLIPRPETEDLVRWILEESPKTKINVLDVCTGSGCIAIALKTHLEDANVSALELSKPAIDTAKSNAKMNASDIRCIEADILQLKRLPETYDIIVSNPPYVRHSEKMQMQDNVTKHEPELALFVADDNALIFYKHIATLAKQHLNKGGMLFFEINEYLAKETKELLKDIGFVVVLRDDIFGKPRMLKATKLS